VGGGAEGPDASCERSGSVITRKAANKLNRNFGALGISTVYRSGLMKVKLAKNNCGAQAETSSY
jgi:hypothetical protein